MRQSTIDANGNVLYPGDYVMFIDAYGGAGWQIGGGKRRRIQNIRDGMLEVFLNSNSQFDPYKTVTVPASAVRIAGRQNKGFVPRSANYYQKEQDMLYVAIKLFNDANYKRIADQINMAYQNEGKSDTFGPSMMADVSQEVLKEKIRQDIARHPDNRWLVLHGNLLAHSEHPPVRFSQW